MTHLPTARTLDTIGYGEEVFGLSIGEALAAARQDRGLTVEDISHATRIRTTLVRAIEHDDFTLCGGAVYARGHIRSIARQVGIDPEPLLAEYDRTSGVAAAARPAAELFESEARGARPERTGPRWGLAMIAAVLVGVSVVALASILSSGNGRGTDSAAVNVPTVSRTPTGRPAARPVPPAKPPRPSVSPTDLALNHSDGVSVRVRVVGARSWVRVTSGTGAKLYEGTLSAGTVRDFKDSKELRLLVGAPTAVALVVNGKDVGLAGPAGPVAHLVFHPGDPGSGSRG